MHDSEIDALVVGGGPTGLAMASDLLRHGVRARVIDRAPGPTNLSRAVVVMPRTLEEFELRGIAQDLVDRGQPVEHFSVYAEGHMILETDFNHLPTRYRYLLSTPQDQTELVLTEHLHRLGGEVEWRTEMLAMEQDGRGVDVEVKKPDGATERVRAKWLMGCDGAHSVTRKMLGIPFKGAQYKDEWVLGDVVIDWDYPHDRTSAFFTQEGYTAIFPMPEGRHRIYASHAEELGVDPTLDDLQRLVERSCAIPAKLRDPRWLSHFHVHHRKAPRYVKGRVFLAGDAAHIHSPESGLGMNTGIQDAFNLAWKIGLVHAGKARSEILDSYQQERSAEGLKVVRASDAMHKAWAVFDPRAQKVRNRFFQLASEFYKRHQRSIDKQSQLAIEYSKSPICSQNLPRRLSPIHAGPAAGTHAIDGDLVVPADVPGKGRRTTLFDRLHGVKHKLLLFAGAPKRRHEAELLDQAETLVNGYGDVVDIVYLTCDETDLAHPDTYVDVTMKLHRDYGANHGAAYLIRPDGYIGYRGCPISPAGLAAHLAGVFSS